MLNIGEPAEAASWIRGAPVMVADLGSNHSLEILEGPFTAHGERTVKGPSQREFERGRLDIIGVFAPKLIGVVGGALRQPQRTP